MKTIGQQCDCASWHPKFGPTIRQRADLGLSQPSCRIALLAAQMNVGSTRPFPTPNQSRVLTALLCDLEGVIWTSCESNHAMDWISTPYNSPWAGHGAKFICFSQRSSCKIAVLGSVDAVDVLDGSHSSVTWGFV